MSKQSCNFEIDDENSICFDKGKFDNFCVYFKTYNKIKILIEGMNTLEASNFSKGLKWITISNHCRKRGF